MASRRLFALLTLGALCAALHAGEAKDYAVRQEQVAPPMNLPEPVRSLLSDRAIELHDGEAHLATLWLRKELPARATPEQMRNGITYREIPPSTVLGAIEWKQPWKDYRKHEIDRGVYTLRLAVQPTSDDHSGTAPHQDFALLCPADKEPNAELLEPKALVERSAESHGGTHPVVMLLYPHPKPEAAPRWHDQGKGVFTLNARLTATAEGQSTPLGFAFTLVK